MVIGRVLVERREVITSSIKLVVVNGCSEVTVDIAVKVEGEDDMEILSDATLNISKNSYVSNLVWLAS